MPSLATTAPATNTLARFRNDFPYYSRVALRIVDKQAQLVPLDLNFAQRKVWALLSKQWTETGRVRALILKARQEGISTEVAGIFMRSASLRKHRRGMVVADVDKR